MKRSIAALAMTTSLVFAASAFAQTLDKVVKVGSLGDQSGLYADIGGPGSTIAAQMAVEDSGLLAKGWKIDVIAADHQNKPDVGTNIGKQWIDVEKVDVFVDLASSGVGLAIANLREGQERRQPELRLGVVGPHRRAMLAEHHSLGLRHLDARQRHRQGAGEVRRRQLVLPHRGLRLRSRARARYRRPSSPPMAARCWATSGIR